jgi:hypothetical protein
MHRDEVTTPWRKSRGSNSGTTRSGKVASRDSASPGGGALSFSWTSARPLLRRSRPWLLTR